MKTSDYIVQYLSAQGITCIYEVIGGMITHIIDSVHRDGQIRLLTVHHEQSAAFAAESTARITGIPGIAMATSGPGATNLLTGIGSCFFDSVPAIFITGQVNRSEQKGEHGMRQLGFQETDIVSMALPVTKAAWKINDASEMPERLEQAFHIALSGRPGPVLLDIPMDVQRMDIPAKNISKISVTRQAPSDHDLLPLFSALCKAERPLIIAGGGIRASRSADLFRQFVECVKIPVVNSLMAVDALPYSHPNRVGLIGTYGNRWANLTVGKADLFLVLGSRLDIRQTGADVEGFRHGSAIFQVDIDENEVNTRVKGVNFIHADVAQFLREAINFSGRQKLPDYSAWMDEINISRQQWPDENEAGTKDGINPNHVLHQLSRLSKEAAGYVVDVGNNQMWAAQSAELENDQFFITSGGMGSMGYALPAAIGATMAAGNRPVVVIAGDGGMQVNIQELETISYHRLPLKIVVLNNRSLGMVRQFQQSYFDSRYAATMWGYSAHDFETIARAYGIDAATVLEEKDLGEGLERLWSDPSQPFLLQVMLDPETNAYPKIAFGLPITRMEPFDKPMDMEGT